MSNKMLLGASDLAEILGMSKPYCYKVIKSMNDELKANGYFTVSGKVSRTYFEEKFYGTGEVSQNADL